MPQITDSTDVPLTYVSMVMDESTDAPVFVIKVPCETGRQLEAEDVVEVRALARLTGSGDPFADLADFPVDLTPHDGLTKSFDIKIHANAVVGLVHAALPIRVVVIP